MSDNHELFEIDPADVQLIEQGIAPEVRDRWPEQLAAMVDVVAAVHRQVPAIEHRAAEIAAKVVLAIAIYRGGQYLYLPRGDRIETALRDRRLHHDWMTCDGDIEALAARYKLTSRRVMQILKEQRALWRREHMPELPGIESK